jgi:hypothetical protein
MWDHYQAKWAKQTLIEEEPALVTGSIRRETLKFCANLRGGTTFSPLF